MRNTCRRQLISVKAVAYIASLVAGAFALSAAGSPGVMRWVGFLAVLPLFLSIRRLRPLAAGACGALWGLAYWFFAIRGDVAAGSPTFIQALVVSGAPAIFAFLGSTLTRWIGFSPFVLGVSWMGVELAIAPFHGSAGLLGALPESGGFLHWVETGLGFVLVAFLVAYLTASVVSILSELRCGGSIPCHRRVPSGCSIAKRSQTFSCFPLYAIPASPARAPPVLAI